jgi:signal transduction histidine kinase
MLYIPLTAKAGQDFIVFFRKSQTIEVQWAGKPYKDEVHSEAASLEPRKSFKTWSEMIIGRSRPWSDGQVECAGVLALICGKFIQVWREKKEAMASNQLTAILLLNTSHALRSPLKQIIATLEVALAADLDANTRDMLERSHEAGRNLLFHVHDLLDLTRIETDNEMVSTDLFDIRQSVNQVAGSYEAEIARKGLILKVNFSQDLPAQVLGDSRKLRALISNLVANSVKFTDKGIIEIYCGLQQSAGDQAVLAPGHRLPIEIVVSDSGCGIPTDKLEAMFITLEGAEPFKATSTGVGLGLAVVARIVEQMAGQLRIVSEAGHGTMAFVTLQVLTA